MNMGLTLLNEIEYARAPMLGSASQQTSLAPSLARSIPVSGNQRPSQLRSPYFVRTLTAAELGAAWTPLCSALRRHEIPIFSSFESLGGVPAVSVPARWSGRPVDEPFQANELTTADLFEVSCLSRDQRRWSWPSEISGERLDGLLRSVRAAAGGDTPVGLNIPLGCHVNDLKRCLAADIDFISLSCAHPVAHSADSQSRSPVAGSVAAGGLPSGVFLAGDLHSVVLCRQMLQQLKRPQLPLLVTAPVEDIEQAHKLLALGASAVSIDQIVRQSIAPDMRLSQQEESESAAPFRLPSLPQRGVSASKHAELPYLEMQLKQARLSLLGLLQAVGVSGLSDFTQHCLVSSTQRVQQVTGVKRLEL